MTRIRAKVLALLCVFALSATIHAAVIRGRLLRGVGVAPGIAITVWCQQLGRSQPSYSGLDGMYYLPNVPAGSYVLEIWAIPSNPPITFNIYVNEPGTDINPIYVP